MNKNSVIANGPSDQYIPNRKANEMPFDTRATIKVGSIIEYDYKNETMSNNNVSLSPR